MTSVLIAVVASVAFGAGGASASVKLANPLLALGASSTQLPTNADDAALASGVPADFTGNPQAPPSRRGPVALRSDTHLALCGGAGGTYTHCEVTLCNSAYPYKNYNPNTDSYTDPFQSWYSWPGPLYYYNGDYVQVRDGAGRRSGPRGVLIYTGTTFGWGWSSIACYGA